MVSKRKVRELDWANARRMYERYTANVPWDTLPSLEKLDWYKRAKRLRTTPEKETSMSKSDPSTAVNAVHNALTRAGIIPPTGRLIRDVINAYDDYRAEHAPKVEEKSRGVGTTVTLYLTSITGGNGDTSPRERTGPFSGEPMAHFKPAHGTSPNPQARLSLTTEQWIALGRPTSLEVVL